MITSRLAKNCILAAVAMVPAFSSLYAADPAAPSATVKIEPIGKNTANGMMTLSQVGQSVEIKGTLNGLTPGKHGFHIHEGRSCSNRGGHFHVGNAPHGAPDAAKELHHMGDLGNVVAGPDGSAQFAYTAKDISLTGANSVAGRVLVVHQGDDDLVSQPGGKSGEQIGCGVIKAAIQ